MRINDVFKKVIVRLRKEGKIATPDAYVEAFCKEAKMAGLVVEDCNQVNKFLPSMDKSLQKEIQDSRVDSLQKLVRLLIGKINRMQPSQAAEKITAFEKLLRKILQSSQVLHNKNVSELAAKTLDALEKNKLIDQSELLFSAWTNFLTSYNDSFLQKLAPYTVVDSCDLEASIAKLSFTTKDENISEKSVEQIVSLLIAALVPSIAPSVNDQIANVSNTLKKNPELVTSKSIVKEIKEAILLRILIDKRTLREMLGSLDTIVDKLSKQLIDLIERSDSSNLEIKNIKKELESYDKDKKQDFKVSHQKLLNIASVLESKTAILSKDLNEHNSEVVLMKQRIVELETELEKAKENSKQDFLTKLYNKRALDEFFKVKEAEFERYGHNYSIVMFDIDFFKKVNDNYGHEAGDKILFGFGKILKKLCRSVDIVGRYGGEEFVAILSETELEGAILFAKKVNAQVEKTRFMYQGQHIPLTVSGGVAERKVYSSLIDTMNGADSNLYIAKGNGRNRIEPESKQ